MSAFETENRILEGFSEGAVLQLTLTPPGDSSAPAGPYELAATITKAYRPFTMSPVLCVTTSAPSCPGYIPSEAILKLYDRRCLSNWRDNHDEGKPWSSEKEREYQRFLAKTATGTTSNLDLDELWRSTEHEMSDGEFEAYLQRTAQMIYNAEREAYLRLSVLQGHMIPRLYGAVEYKVTIDGVRDDGGAVVETIPGLLLEFVPGLTLRQLIRTWTTRCGSRLGL